MKPMKAPKMPDTGDRNSSATPDVAPGDHVYFHLNGEPTHGRVLAHGQHGVTVRHAGERRNVHWKDVLGYRERSERAMSVVDKGEDGAIMQDERGRRKFVAGYRDASANGDGFGYNTAMPDVEDGNNEHVDMTEGVRKAMPVVFMLGSPDVFAKALKNRPGLSLQATRDKSGKATKRWKKTGPDEKKGRKAAAGDEARGSTKGYGTHNLQPGDKIRFKAGDFSGSGEIVGKPGKDGAHVRDASGRLHRVAWSEVSGHDTGEAKKPEVDRQVIADQEPIDPDKFSAADYAKGHDQADVTPEQILSSFPADTEAKIADVQARLKGVEETIAAHSKDGKYTVERNELHQKIVDEFLSDERVAAATPGEGEQPTFTILGGRGGSGKSWFKGKVYDPKKSIVLDADEIKSKLPEYEGWNAAQVHEESGELFDRITRDALAMGLNIVHDATMKTASKAVAQTKRFKDAGYRVEAHYMHLPRQEAAKRAVSRFLGKTQRYVPVDVVLSNTGNEASFDEVRKLADSWSFRDNNVAQGEEPILISEGGDANISGGSAKDAAAKS